MRCFLVLCLFLPIVFGNAELYPSFPEQYTAHGFLLLPYAEIKEPFAAYYDGELNRSRIDFYDGLVITLQKSKAAEKKSASRYGSEYMIAYESDLKGDTKRGCFKTEGSEESEVNGQSMLPNLDGFTKIGRSRCPNALNNVEEGNILYSMEKFSKNSELFGDHPRSCELWKKKDQVGEKVSTYSFYVRKDQKTGEYIPVAYIMEGFNSLLGSHYDHYVVYYTAFRNGLLNDDMFDVDKNYKCGGFPGPGAKQNKLVMNPMKAYFDNSRSSYDEHFHHYKNKHNKNYDTESEHEFRRKVFLDNSRFIHSSNRRSKTYKLSVNHLADKSEDELKVLNGRAPSKGYNGGIPFSSEIKTEDLPKSIDWRLYGAVNPVKDQATCGSCWSFSTTGSIEGVNFVKTGHLVSLSEQFLVDCAWGELCNGCSGCDFPKAAQAIMNRGGIALTETYGHYLGVDGKCHANDVKKSVKLEGYVNVTRHSIEDLKKALVENGPIAVAIRAGLKTFSFYSNGVYNDPECVGDEDEQLNHAVLLVGYGTLKGEDYWLIKNSWSTYWGNDGYILIAQKNNICGVTTTANYPIISDS